MVRLLGAMAMAEDSSDHYRTVSGIALRFLPDHPDVLVLEIRTQHGPFRFGMSQHMAVKVAGQIGDHAKLLKPSDKITRNDGRMDCERVRDTRQARAFSPPRP
jgi:hypothetical protein